MFEHWLEPVTGFVEPEPPFSIQTITIITLSLVAVGVLAAEGFLKAGKAAEAKALTEIFGYDPTDTSNVPAAGPTGTTEGGAKGSWLQDLGQRLKLLKESSFDALSPLKELRKFYGEGAGKTVNPVLQDQKGALDAIRKEAKDAGIVLSEEFMSIIEGFLASSLHNSVLL